MGRELKKSSVLAYYYLLSIYLSIYPITILALRKPRALGRGPFGGGGVRGAAAAALRLRGQPTTPGAAPQRGPLKNEKKSAAAMAANPAAVTLRVQILQVGVLYI